MGKKNPSNLQQDGDAETRGLSRPEGAVFGRMSEGEIPLAMASGGRHDHHHVEHATPTVSNPHHADNPHTAEKFLSKKSSTDGDAAHAALLFEALGQRGDAAPQPEERRRLVAA